MAIYRDHVDRLRFLELLQQTNERHDVACLTYCLMDNHYHLVLSIVRPNLSTAVQRLNGGYAQWWNRRHQHTGHLLQGRFHSRIVQEEDYLREVCRYVVLNPVEANLVRRPADWRWSSYRALAGLEPAPAFLDIEPVLASFGAPGDPNRISKYREFVESPPGLPEVREAARAAPCVVGGTAFADALLPSDRRPREVTCAQWHQARPTLETLFLGAARREDRHASIFAAHCRYEYSMRQIADHLGVHYTTISRAIAAVGSWTGSHRAECDNARPDPS